MSHIEKIAIIDYTTAQVFVYPISEYEQTEHFLKRKGFNDSEVAWVRGNIKVNIEKETIQDEDEN